MPFSSLFGPNKEANENVTRLEEVVRIPKHRLKKRPHHSDIRLHDTNTETPEYTE